MINTIDRESKVNNLKKVISTNEARLFILLILLMIIMSMLSPEFLTISNIFSVTQQMSELGVMALGMTMVIITSGIDLSLGAIAGFTTIVIATTYGASGNIAVAIVTGIVLGTLCGAVNGYLVGKIKAPAMLVTLGSQTLFNGFALAISKGNAISNLPNSYFMIGQGYIGVVPVQTIIFIVLAVIITILLEKTPWGNYVYSVGNNPVATTFSGIKTSKILIYVYIFAGFLASVSGIIISSRVSTARADLGQVYVLQCVTAAVLGGTNISGGSGKVIGTFLGVFVMAVLQNGLNLAGVNSFTQNLIMGAMLIVVLLINNYSIISSKIKLFIRLKYSK